MGKSEKVKNKTAGWDKTEGNKEQFFIATKHFSKLNCYITEKLLKDYATV